MQEEREQSALIVVYTSPAQIPDNPAEPQGSQLSEEQVDDGVCHMLTGPDVDSIFGRDIGVPAPMEMMLPAGAGAGPSVKELIGQLNPNPPPDVAMAMGDVYSNTTNFSPEYLQQLMQQLTQGAAFNGLGPTGAVQTPPQHPGPQADPSQSWGPGNQYGEYDRGYHENGAGRGGGGDPNRRWHDDAGGWGAGPGPSGGGDRGGLRGRGRGGPVRGVGRGRGDFRNTKRKPCSFFQAGRRASSSEFPGGCPNEES